jgi:hypothetical protein
MLLKIKINRMQRLYGLASQELVHLDQRQALVQPLKAGRKHSKALKTKHF